MASWTTCADYFVGEVIGEGAFGRVLHCQHKESENSVAIKVFDKHSLVRRPNLRELVLTEQRMLRELKDCPYVVNLWASFHDTHCVYLVLECCMGGDLEQLIERRTMQDLSKWERIAAFYGHEIWRAIEWLHQKQKVLHGDLKPSNILLTCQGRIRLADFGSAIELDQGFRDSYKGPYLGTSAFASPEIIRAVPIDVLTPAIDIWSFGCVLYALWMGNSPFDAPTDSLVVTLIEEYGKTDKLNRIRFLKSNSTPEHWTKLIADVIDPEPDGRLSCISNVTNSAVWNGTESLAGPPLSPIQPTWARSINASLMTDGTAGWTAFLD
jgi:serine/threonine protein kinase